VAEKADKEPGKAGPSTPETVRVTHVRDEPAFVPMATVDTMDAGAGGASERIAAGTRVGRYVIGDVLGEGGAGQVYAALDPELDRRVAIKLLRVATADLPLAATAPSTSRGHGRLWREAQAMAKLTHPNVLPVFDVGVAGDRLFLAMELVEGGTLRGWLREGHSAKEALAVIMQAGRGLAAAHAAGLIHRDFKPDNVLIGRDGRVRVTDFGLVRALDAPELPPDHDATREPMPTPRMLATPLTQAASVMGTPGYMAPEQYAAAATDARTDQFSFCVTLYEALYGARPFAGKTMDELKESTRNGRIIEPPPQAKVPPWLRRAILRGLEIDPEKRWPSMDALLAALADDPLVRRRRMVAAGAALLALVVAAGLGWRAYARAARDGEEAQRFVREVDQFDALMRQSALLPLHDTRADRGVVETRLATIEKVVPRLVTSAQGTARYALGRGYLALGDAVRAHTELQEAWAAGNRSPELSYVLGRALGELYRIHRSELAGLEGDARAQKERELATTYREPALERLRHGVALETESPELEEARIAFYDERYDDALARAAAALARSPWLHEARRLQGDVHFAVAEELAADGKPKDALARYARAGEAYRAAIEIAHSDVPALEGECARIAGMALVGYDIATLDEKLAPEATLVCDRATTAHPGRVIARTNKARALMNVALVVDNRGGDAKRPFDDAIAAGEDAVRVAEDYDALVVLADTRVRYGLYRARHGGDPLPLFDAAVASYETAAKARPRDWTAPSQLSQALAERAAYRDGRGEDARADLERAVSSAERATATGQGGWKTFNRLGAALNILGIFTAAHGGDGDAIFERSEKAYGKVIALAPGIDYGYVNSCEMEVAWARARQSRGSDAADILDRAIRHCTRALELTPTWLGSDLALAQAYHLRGKQAADPSPWIEKGRAAVAAGLKLDGKSGPMYAELAEVELVAALAAAQRSAALARALAAWRKARQLAPEDASIREIGARLHEQLASDAAARHQPVTTPATAGLAEVAAVKAVRAPSPDLLATEQRLTALLDGERRHATRQR
jgi:tetratricopeptide (TPR) repeat protein